MRRNSLEAVLTTHCVEYEDTVTVEEAEQRYHKAYAEGFKDGRKYAVKMGGGD
jgi:hypothetical protein